MANTDDIKILFPNIYDNYVNDDLLSVEMRNQFNSAIRRVNIDGLSAEEAKQKLGKVIDDFCHSHQQLGPEIVLAFKEMIGCLRDLDTTAEFIASNKGTGYSLNDVKDFILNDVIALNSAEKQKISLYNYLGNIPLSPFQVFSFRSSNPEYNPFEDVIEGCNPRCRLAINHYVDEHLGFAYILPNDVKPCRPTFFDAARDKLWRPGGKTIPLNYCGNNCEDGEEEVVHNELEVNWLADIIFLIGFK